MRSIYITLLVIASWLIALFCLQTSGHAYGMPALQPPQATFIVTDDKAGVTASHQGSWDEYSEHRAFTDGYLAMGQAWGDYDNDGWIDLYVTGGQAPSVLYRNQGDGTFAESTLASSVSLPDRWTGGAVWADYDNDGWRDLYVLVHGANVLFHNNEGTGFTDVTATAGMGDPGKSSTATWGDFNGDSFLDLYVTNWSCYPACDPVDHTQAQDRLYQNNGDGTFTDVSHLLTPEKLLGAGFAATFVDIDDDRDPDLYVVNDALMNPIGNAYWRNDGPDKNGSCGGWCWTDASAANGAGTVVEGMGLAIGDYDNDLDLDFYYSNMVNPSELLQNQGQGTFAEVAERAGVDTINGATVGWGTSFFDYDNDGWLDLFLATTEFRRSDPNQPPDGMHFGHPNLLYRNNGIGASGAPTFTNVTPATWYEVPRSSMGTAYADYDQDGRVDFVTGDWNQGYVLYRNVSATGAENNWFAAHLVGDGPVNRDAAGARLYLTDSNGKTQLREVRIGSSLGAGEDTDLYFGLGGATVADVKVIWPDGVSVTFTDLPVNERWYLTYPDRVGMVAAIAPTRPTATPATAPVVTVPTATATVIAAENPAPAMFPTPTALVSAIAPATPASAMTIAPAVNLAAADDALLATAWFDLYLALIETTEGFTPPVAARAIGYGSVTFYEALAPGLPGYQSLVGQLNGLRALPPPLPDVRYHWPTVANSALAAITRMLFSNTTVANKDAIALLELQFAERNRPLLDAATFDRSTQYGRALAVAIYSWSVTDGGHEGQLRNFLADYTTPTGSGLWEATPPGYANALQPFWGNNRPLAMRVEQPCVVAPPIPYSETVGSPFYQLAQEVYETVRLLTPEQRIIARYWADDPGRTPTPPGHSLAVATQLLRQTDVSLARAAETYARVGIALNDAFIGCWQTKYQYNRIRPLTFIQRQIDPT